MGPLSLGHHESPVKRTTCINYFITNNIKIRVCNNRIYTFGLNYFGQIGDVLSSIVDESEE